MPKNLIAFGCSLVYGYGLLDCHVHPNLPGPKASKLAWPNLLADISDLNCVNLSNPGASNFQLILTLLNYKFDPNDICIIMWTYPDRDLIIHDDDNMEKIGVWRNKNRFTNWLELNPDKTIYFRFWSWITLTFSWLQNQGIESYFLLPEPNLYKTPPHWAKHIKFLSANMKDIRKKYPKALDNHHPGPEAHEAFAREVFDEIFL
jgi:hypothetical protein